MSLPVAILAGGKARRLGRLAEATPKILLDVAGRPFAEHQIRRLKQEGVSDVIYCVGHLGERIQAVLGDGHAWGMTFRYVDDGPAPAGTGGAIRSALPLLGDAFFVMYGDSLLDCRFNAVENAFRKSGRPALMTVFPNDNRWDDSNVVYDGDRISIYDKAHRVPEMRHIDYGLAILTPGVFDPYAGRKSFDLAELYAQLAREGRLAGFEVSERFYEIGSIRGLEETRAFLDTKAAPQL